MENTLKKRDENKIEELAGEAKSVFTKKTIFLVHPIRSISKNSKDRVSFLKAAMKNPALWGELTDEIFSDLVVGAYQDKIALSAIVSAKNHESNVETLRSIQKMRQSADNHLLNILKVVRDIKRPPVQVVIKKAEQVNVCEQINQGEQQVNIAKNQQPI